MYQHIQQLQEHAIQKTSEMSYAASAIVSGSGLLTWFADNSSAIGAIGVLIGAIIAIATWAVNLYFKRHADQRAQELHEKKMKE